ncbi:MCP four helix bundle domain-containing protein, partial [Modestobacter lapidis]
MNGTPITLSRRFRDLGVQTKILAAIGTAVAAALTVGTVGLTSLSATADRTTAMYEQNTVGAQLAEHMQYQYISYRFDALNRVNAPTPEAKEAFGAQRDAAGEAVLRAAERMRTETRPTADVVAALDEVVTDFNTYLGLAAQLNQLAAAGRQAEFNELRSTQVAPLSDQLLERLEGLSALQQERALASSVAAEEAYAATRNGLAIVLVLGSGLALLAGVVVARSITGALARVRRSAERLADGDLTHETGVDQRDDVGRMAAAIDAARESLRGLMSSVAASADAVAASSEELSASSAQISASAEETSAQSGVVSAAAEE